jgi:hypothetical protein
MGTGVTFRRQRGPSRKLTIYLHLKMGVPILILGRVCPKGFDKIQESVILIETKRKVYINTCPGMSGF